MWPSATAEGAFGRSHTGDSNAASQTALRMGPRVPRRSVPVLQSKAMRVSVLGAGYVGLTTATCLADIGHTVTVFDTNPERAIALRRGEVPFHEPRLPDLLANVVASGRLRPVADVEDAMTDAELILVCVGTPLDLDGEADLSQVHAACRSIAARTRATPVVIRSTLPLGETINASSWLSREGLQTVATNPEFLRQGAAIDDFMAPTRIVIGTPDGRTNTAAEALIQLYAGISAPTLVTDFNSAEMIKNAANAYLATKLSFVNEVADLCDAYGADITAVVNGIGLDPRIGATYLGAGIGFGGSCLPKELANMVRLGHRRGLAVPLMAGAAQTNEQRPSLIVDRIEDAVGSVRGCRVALLGLAFKPNTDDTRYSPAIALAEKLITRGAVVVAHDPVARLARSESLTGFSRAENVVDAIEGSDIVVLATEWPEYLDLDWPDLATRARGAVVFDGRNMLDAERVRAAGWRVMQVGRASR